LTPENQILPDDIRNLMRSGICPICKRKMKKNNGKPTHTKNASKVCEELLRDKFKIRPTKFKIGDKTYEPFARLGTRDEVEKKN
jgi:hypothetical protein